MKTLLILSLFILGTVDAYAEPNCSTIECDIDMAAAAPNIQFHDSNEVSTLVVTAAPKSSSVSLSDVNMAVGHSINIPPVGFSAAINGQIYSVNPVEGSALKLPSANVNGVSVSPVVNDGISSPAAVANGAKGTGMNKGLGLGGFKAF